MEVDPQTLLDMNLAELTVRGEAVLDILIFTVAALAETGYKAARAGDDEIVEHVAETLATVQGRLAALTFPEEATDAT